MVSPDTIITFDVQGTTDLFFATDPATVRSEVMNELSKNFDVMTAIIKPPSVIQDLMSGLFVNSPYTAVITLQTRSAYGRTSDIGSVIAHAFYNAVGALPTVNARPVAVQPSPSDQPIEEQGPTLGSIGTGLEGAAKGVTDSIAAAFKALEESLGKTALLLVGGLVIIVAIIAFSPAGREGARSVGRIRAI